MTTFKFKSNKNLEEKVREIFDEYDQNGNGLIEKSELREALAKCEKDPLFDKIVIIVFFLFFKKINF